VILAALTALACLLPPVDAPVARPFRAPACEWCPGHRGLEYATASGETVRAAADGIVSFNGSVAGVRYLVVRHRDGLLATYGGVVSPELRVGQRVRRADPVGRTTGRLHFGLRDGQTYLDPTPLLAVRTGRPRLVPSDGVGRRRGGAVVMTCAAEVRVRGRPR